MARATVERTVVQNGRPRLPCPVPLAAGAAGGRLYGLEAAAVQGGVRRSGPPAGGGARSPGMARACTSEVGAGAWEHSGRRAGGRLVGWSGHQSQVQIKPRGFRRRSGGNRAASVQRPRGFRFGQAEAARKPRGSRRTTLGCRTTLVRTLPKRLVLVKISPPNNNYTNPPRSVVRGRSGSVLQYRRASAVESPP